MSGQMREAWRTVVPDLADRHGPLPPLMLALTIVTGVVDAFSYLILGHVFVANLTGNVVFLAFSIAGASGFSAWASVAALLAFGGGSVIGGRIAHARSAHRGQMLLGVTALEATLLLAAFGYAQAEGAPYEGIPKYILIVLASVAMGAQNAAARALSVPDLTTTVLTLTLTGVAADGRLAGGTNSRIGRRLTSVTAMLVGALVGALIAVHGSAAIALLVAALVLILVATIAVPLARSDRPWTQPS